jgi:hypothetical protein
MAMMVLLQAGLKITAYPVKNLRIAEAIGTAPVFNNK